MPYIPIEEAIAACKAAGNTMVPGLKPIQSDLKRETSLIGQAYLNYIYQNDIANEHFCQAMLLMHAQVPKAAESLCRFVRSEKRGPDACRTCRCAALFRLRHRPHGSAESESRSVRGDLEGHREIRLSSGLRPARSTKSEL